MFKRFRDLTNAMTEDLSDHGEMMIEGPENTEWKHDPITKTCHKLSDGEAVCGAEVERCDPVDDPEDYIGCECCLSGEISPDFYMRRFNKDEVREANQFWDSIDSHFKHMLTEEYSTETAAAFPYWWAVDMGPIDVKKRTGVHLPDVMKCEQMYREMFA